MKLLIIQNAVGHWMVKLIDGPRATHPNWPREWQKHRMSFMNVSSFETKKEAEELAKQILNSEIIYELEETELNYSAKKRKAEFEIEKENRLIEKIIEKLQEPK